MEVTLINRMGNDLTVVNAARVSMAKESEYVYEMRSETVKNERQPYDWDYGKNGYWPETKTIERPVCLGLSDKDKKLISYLAVHDHWTPFAHCQITMREKVPIFVARQRFKHTVGFAYNEVSRRYVDDGPKFFRPDEWRKRADSVKQGSSEDAVNPILRQRMHGDMTVHDAVARLNVHALDLYNELLEHDVCPEQARMVLPQSMYTEYYVTGSLAAWARAYKLRSDKHAQKEIRDLAAKWDAIIQPLYPESWKWLTVS
jgi:thymidylate synthase (FAD)